MLKKGLLIKFLQWRVRNLSDNLFVIILSIIIGLVTGLAAFLLKKTVYSIEDEILGFFQSSEQIYYLLLFPFIGIILTVLFLKYIVRDDVGHGVPRILYAISKLDGSMRRHKIFSSLVGGSLTAGFGGSVGLESPIISTGASVGSFLGQILKLSYKHKTLLIGCGVTGAMASIFTTPIAAVIFGFEVLLLDLSTAAIIPLLIASVTGAVTTKMLLNEQYLVHFKVTQEFIISDIPFFIVLGILAGFVSVYFHYVHFQVIKLFSKVKSFLLKAVIGGALLGVLVFLFPPLYSEGYEAIRHIVSGESQKILNYSLFADNTNIWFLVAFAFLLLIFKVFATTITTESGGVGGIFAPAAMMGGLTGFILSRSINNLFSNEGLHESNFTLIGMASVLGGVLQAPLTAIFIIAEMSNGYELIVPLMLSTSIAFLIARTFNKHSIFHRRLIEQGLFLHFRDKSVLKQMKIEDLVEKNVLTININDKLGDMVELVKKSSRNIYAVVDDENIFIGLVSLDDIKGDMFNKDKYEEPISDYLYHMLDDEKVSIDEDVHEVMNKFNRTGNYNLLVLDGNYWVGVLSKANTLKAYRENLLAEESDERG